MTPAAAETAAQAATLAETAGGIDASIWWSFAAIAVLLLLSAFFSGSETALTASSRAKLHGLADKGDARAATALKLTEDGEKLIGSILLGNNLVNILAASMATSAFTALFGESGVALATIVMTFLVLVFAEVTPKTYAITAPEAAATRVAPVIVVVVKVFAPVVGAITVLVRLLLRLFGVQADPDASVLAHEEIRGAIDLHHSEGAVEKDDRDRLLAALDLRHREVSEVMAHRQSMEAVDAGLPPREILAFCLASAYTRIPVWRDEPENIIGVIHAKDLLRAVHELSASQGWEGIDSFDVMKVAMEPWFIPDTTTLDDQMRAFLKRRSHFALVVDEYGDLQGLLTLEDILEEIVGDIADEHDLEVEGLERLADGSVLLDGAMTIRDVNRACEWQLPDEEANTIAGLVIHEAQAIPSAGQIFSFHGFRFEVMERTRNQISRLKVKRLET